ncbi:hypothetical protein FQN57_001134 [Myotisia sp. PD_48]|nr:hypothetical protein FQN57_001134 [Myotisia sp. PD_48]
MKPQSIFSPLIHWALPTIASRQHYDSLCPHGATREIEGEKLTVHCDVEVPTAADSFRLNGVNDPEKCARICLYSDVCEGAIWRHVDNACWAISGSPGPTISSPGSIYISRGDACTRENQSCQREVKRLREENTRLQAQLNTYTGADREGGPATLSPAADSNIVATPSFTACIEACAAREGCLQALWSAAGNCYLRNFGQGTSGYEQPPVESEGWHTAYIIPAGANP